MKSLGEPKKSTNWLLCKSLCVAGDCLKFEKEGTIYGYTTVPVVCTKMVVLQVGSQFLDKPLWRLPKTSDNLDGRLIHVPVPR